MADIPKELIERARQREKRSLEHEQRFRAGDEMAIREFCRIDPFSMQTPWVVEAIQTALLCGNADLLKKIFTGKKGDGKSRVTVMTENLLIYDAINRLAKETGLPKKNPANFDSVFHAACDNQILTFGKEGLPQELEPKTLFHRYYEAQKQIPDVMIVRDKAGALIRTGPALCKVEDKSVIGIHELYFPSDGTGPEVRVTGVINIPATKEEKEAIPFQ